MKGVKIYVEGGGDGKETHTRCVNAFTELLKKAGFKGKMPRMVACGGRGSTYDDFATACQSGDTDYYPILLVDSEDPVTDESRWEHVMKRDHWAQPPGVTDEQIHFMATCMETWIVADRATLSSVFGACLKENSLPPLVKLENRPRHEVQNSLEKATVGCGKDKQYQKGKRSFQVLAGLNPEALKQHLPHFVNFLDSLHKKLG